GHCPSRHHCEPGRARVMIAGENYRTVHDGNWNVERRLRDMKAHGADLEVISPMPELCAYWFTPEDALDFCRSTNDVVVRMCEKAPGRFIGLGIVPLQSPDLAARELARIKSLGLPGIELGSNVNGKSLGMPEFQSFFQEGARLRGGGLLRARGPPRVARDDDGPLADQGALQPDRLSHGYGPDHRVDDRRRHGGEVPQSEDRFQPRRRHLPVSPPALQPPLERDLERGSARAQPRSGGAPGRRAASSP